MIEVFVIYNKKNGYIDGGAGRIDRKWDKSHKDGSTMSERILDILAKNPDRKVVYLPDQDLPDPARHKIKDNKIIDLTEIDKRNIKSMKSKSEIELLKERINKLEKKL